MAANKESLVVKDPELIAVIKAAVAGYQESKGRAKSLRRLDTLAARIYAWLEEHGHGTVAELARSLNADISSVTRAAKELLQADQCAIVYEKHQDGIGQRRTRLRVLQARRVTLDLGASN